MPTFEYTQKIHIINNARFNTEPITLRSTSMYVRNRNIKQYSLFYNLTWFLTTKTKV